MIYPFPLFVYPSLRCNFTCSYCFNDSGPREEDRSFILGSWEKFVVACEQLHVPEMRLSGGEPLLVHDIQAKCASITAHGMTYTILTNGSLLPRHLNWLSKSPPETLWLSYHREFSSAATFHERVTWAVEAVPRVGIHVFASDVWTTPRLVEDAVRAGVERVKLLNLTPIGRCVDGGRTLRWSSEAAESITRRWQRLTKRSLEVRIAAPLIRQERTGEATCVLRERPLLSVNHDGRVYPCCVTLGSEPAAVGNLQVETLEEIVRRASQSPFGLACSAQLPFIENGTSSCPLQLARIRSGDKHLSTAAAVL